MTLLQEAIKIIEDLLKYGKHRSECDDNFYECSQCLQEAEEYQIKSQEANKFLNHLRLADELCEKTSVELEVHK